MERWTFPLLTEYLQIIYSLFYFLPVTLVAILWSKKKFTEFQKVVIAGFALAVISLIVSVNLNRWWKRKGAVVDPIGLVVSCAYGLDWPQHLYVVL